MPIMVAEGPKYVLCPAGTFQGVCVDVIVNGKVVQEFRGKKKLVDKVTLRVQLAEVNAETGKRYSIQKRYTLSLNEKATLRKDLEGWRGRAFTKEELAGFDLEKLLGANGLFSVVHFQGKTDPTQTFASIQSVMALPKGMERISAVDYVRECDRPDAPNAEKEPEADEVLEF